MLLNDILEEVSGFQFFETRSTDAMLSWRSKHKW